MHSSRGGFSVIELLIVIGIVLVAITLVGLAVVSVRNLQTSAKRTQTISYLKQVCLAAHCFNDVHKRLPPGYGRSLKPIGPNELPRTVHIHFLPYIEQDPLYQLIQNSGADSNVVDVGKWTNGNKLFGAHVHIFDAPLDSSTANRSGVQNLAVNFRIFCNKELQKAGDENMTWPALPNPHVVPDDEAPNPWDAAASIPETFKIDGTSNTIMFATRYARCGAGIEGGSLYAAHPGTTYGAFFGVQGANVLATHKATAEARPTFQLSPRTYECNPHASLFAHSIGSGGLQIGLADASCRNVAPTISVRTWNLAIQPNDGRVLGSDWNN